MNDASSLGRPIMAGAWPPRCRSETTNTEEARWVRLMVSPRPAEGGRLRVRARSGLGQRSGDRSRPAPVGEARRACLEERWGGRASLPPATSRVRQPRAASASREPRMSIHEPHPPTASRARQPRAANVDPRAAPASREPRMSIHEPRPPAASPECRSTSRARQPRAAECRSTSRVRQPRAAPANREPRMRSASRVRQPRAANVHPRAAPANREPRSRSRAASASREPGKSIPSSRPPTASREDRSRARVRQPRAGKIDPGLASANREPRPPTASRACPPAPLGRNWTTSPRSGLPSRPMRQSLLALALLGLVAAGCRRSDKPAPGLSADAPGAASPADPTATDTGTADPDPLRPPADPHPRRPPRHAAPPAAPPRRRAASRQHRHAHRGAGRPDPNATKVGYLRAGAVVEIGAAEHGKAGCPGGWRKIKPYGFVCLGPEATLDLKSIVRALTRRPDITQSSRTCTVSPPGAGRCTRGFPRTSR